ncbi:MAG: CHAP domain-containing protein [Oscillospiraceae bacterium]|nr:CHAP domain-containing protein [Oscillospiraceae bacterium]
MTPLEIAIGEIGVTESPKNSNNVKYNTWYYGREVSGDAYPWCMAFVQWCFDKAGLPLPYKTASCSALLGWYRKNAPSCVSYGARKGDIAIFAFGHTGIVESVTSDTVTCIEGNTSASDASNGGEVMRATRPLSKVSAFIRPFEETDYLTGEEIYKRLSAYLADKPAPDWAKDELEEAKRLGITDGTRPNAFATRAEAAIMVARAVKGKYVPYSGT